MFCLETDLVLHLAAFLIFFSLLIYLASTGLENNQRKRMLLIALCLALGSLERAFAHNTCVTKELLMHAENILKPFWVASTALCVLFAVGLTKFEKAADSLWANLAVAGYIIIAVVFQWTGEFETMSATSYGWLINNNTPLGRIYVISDTFLSFACLPLLLHGVLRNRDEIRRRQAGIVLVFASIAVAGQNIFGFFMPGSFIADSADLFDLFLVAGAVIAISRYRLASLTSEFASRAIFKNSDEIMALLGMDAVIVEANMAFAARVGIGEHDLKGRKLRILFSGGEKDEAEILLKIRASGILRSEEIALAGGGTGLLTAAVLKIGKIDAGIVCVISDITALKQMQAELAENLEHMKKLDDIKTSMSHGLTHDMRTPMVSIMGYTQLILRGAAGDISLKTREMLEAVSRSTERQLKLINSLLDVAKMENSGVVLEKKQHNALKTILDVVVELGGAAAARSVTLSFEPAVSELNAEADEFRLWQVFENIIGNAIKYAPQNSTVVIKAGIIPELPEIPAYADVSALVKSPEYMVFSVKDSGPGIRAEDIERVFEKFVMSERAPEGQKGTGIGLTIAKGIVRAHGGVIWAESKGNGKGAEFKALIPLG